MQAGDTPGVQKPEWLSCFESCWASGVAEPLDARWGGNRQGVVGKVVWARWEGLKSHGEESRFYRKGNKEPWKPL